MVDSKTDKQEKLALEGQRNSAIADIIRTLRVRLGRSQNEMGDYLGVTFQQVQKMEKGNNRISCGRLMAIAEFLGVDIRELYPISCPDVTGAAKETPKDVHDPLRPSDLALRASARFDRIQDRKIRQRTFDLIETLGEAYPSAIQASKRQGKGKVKA